MPFSDAISRETGNPDLATRNQYRIVKMAGKDVKNVYDYTHALGEMKGGEEYEVEIVRAGQRMTLKLVPEKR